MRKISVPSSELGAKLKKKFGIGWYLSLVATGELLVALALATFLSYNFREFFQELLGIPVGAWVVIFGLLIGSTLAFFLNKPLLSPIRRLDESMEEVARGNFKVRMKNESHFKDIEHIYRNFNLMVRELEANEMLKSDFISNVSHEIKTPITAIEGYAMLLQDEGRGGEDEKYVEKILLNTKRLSELVGNILLLSKLDSQSIESHAERYSLDEQIRQAILLLEPKWTAKDIQLDVELDATDFVGNAGMIMHVWSNLIGNAVKFSPDGKTVTIRLKSTDGRAVFSVGDEGAGVPEGMKERIFDRFYQGDSSHKSEGNGLGLSLVKRIVDITGGSVEVENLVPHGCLFTVTLPLRQERIIRTRSEA